MGDFSLKAVLVSICIYIIFAKTSFSLSWVKLENISKLDNPPDDMIRRKLDARRALGTLVYVRFYEGRPHHSRRGFYLLGLQGRTAWSTKNSPVGSKGKQNTRVTMTTLALIKEAILALKDRTGSSTIAINKWLESEKKVRRFEAFCETWVQGPRVRIAGDAFFCQMGSDVRNGDQHITPNSWNIVSKPYIQVTCIHGYR